VFNGCWRQKSCGASFVAFFAAPFTVIADIVLRAAANTLNQDLAVALTAGDASLSVVNAVLVTGLPSAASRLFDMELSG
jgi:hypothetical protein